MCLGEGLAFRVFSTGMLAEVGAARFKEKQYCRQLHLMQATQNRGSKT